MKRFAFWVFIFSLNSFGLTPESQKKLNELRKERVNKGWDFQIGPTWALDQDLKSITGLIVPKNWQEKAVYKNVQMNKNAVPFMWDWRSILGSVTPPIKNQKNCGSCWAFGTVAAMEFSYAHHEKDQKLFSEQELVSCSRYGTCRGGYFAHSYHQTPGAALEKDFPYRASDVGCKSGLSQNEKIFKYYYVGDRDRKPTTMELKKAIYKHGAVAVTITSNSAMQAYKGGIFTGCTSYQTNHIVALVGWGYQYKNGKPQEYWIMRNSWGEDWGEDGYMRIPYGCSRVGESATYVVYKGGS